MTIEFEKRGSRAVELWSCQSVQQCLVLSAAAGSIQVNAEESTQVLLLSAEGADWFSSWPQLVAGANLSPVGFFYLQQKID